MLPEIHELTPPPDPLETFERLEGLRERLFFDSAAGGRFSFLVADPWELVKDPTRLREAMSAHPAADVPGLPPFQGGAAGFVSYGWGHGERADIEPFRFGLYDWVIAWDHQEERAWLISTGRPDLAAGRRLRATARASEILKRLSAPAGAPPSPSLAFPRRTQQELGRVHPFPGTPGVMSGFSEDGYILAVQQVLDRIAQGEVRQVNLSQRFEAPLRQSPWSLYKRLRSINPAPFAAFYEMGDWTIASASPERFLSVDGRRVETRPIKGTRKRGATEAEDERLAAELLGSEKDRRENRLIVDLLSEELGPLCLPGSVRLRAFCTLERHATVQHLVSILEGELEEGRDPLDLLRRMSPGASIVGSPKEKAMEMIGEIEPVSRGAYCGSIAWWSHTGPFDSSILIRTMVASGDRVFFSAGGGIVEGSDPEAEWQETLHKAYAFLETMRALP